MAEFEVVGPMKVPVTKLKVAKVIERENIEQFWEENIILKDRKGCYVFIFRAGGGHTPIYVGKATKSFGSEVFTSHKIKIYQRAFANILKGTPMLFFVCEDIRKGPTAKKEIDELETFLIHCGKLVNEYLLNERKITFEKWIISGVFGKHKGKPNASAKTFKKTMGMHKPIRSAK